MSDQGDLAARRAAYRAGFVDMLGPAPGVFAWGLVTGVAMVKMGLGTFASVAVSLAAYAGSAQLATLPLVLGGAAWWVVLLTAVVINLRFTVYSATLGQLFAAERPWQRFLLGYGNGDVTFLRLLAHIDRQPDDPQRRQFYWGGVCANWLAWQLSSLLGIFAATRIPTQWGLEVAGTLALVAVLAPSLRTRPAVLGAAVAGLAAYVARNLPLHLGVMVGLIAGVVVAVLVAPAAAAGNNGQRS
jgi:predicted branched-subunit amino acid permease